ncbi:MAG: helix-turn-helix domain-containing protein [Rhodospirillales bacterium]
MKEADPDKVEALAAQGLTVEQIAGTLGMSRSTLYERMGSESDVLDAIKRGRAKGVATVSNALFQSAKGGNTTAQIFYLKNRSPADWADRKAIEHTGKDGKTIDMKWMVEVVEPKHAEDTSPE